MAHPLGWLPGPTSYTLFAGLLCPPVGVAVALLHYRLWDLDRLVAGSGSPAVAAATLAAAALFQPLRRRDPGAGRPALQPPPL
jgi:hypothetical protein